MKKNDPKAFSLIELSIVILIIGILVAGVTQGSRLVTEFRINTARTITQSSIVASTPDLALWLEPSYEGSFTSVTGLAPEEGDAISAWNDINTQIPQKINFTQTTPTSRPLYKKAAINNLPGLLFDGIDDFLQTTTTAIPAGYNNYTMFMVWKQNVNTGVQVIFHQHGPSCSADYAGIYVSGGSTNGWACGAGDTPGSAYTVTKPYASIYRVSNTSVALYTNGTKVTATQTLSLGASSMFIGSNGALGYPYNGYIVEIIVFTRALKETEITEIRAYLSKKYAFSA